MPDSLGDEIVATIGRRMEQRGFSQRMLALRSGVDHATISRLLRGGRDPEITTAVALLDVLGYELVVTRREATK